MSQVTFSTLLSQLAGAYGYNVRRLHQHLLDSGIDISYATIASYHAFRTVPTFETAKSILNAFNYSISDEELTNILSLSRSEISEYKEDTRKTIMRSIKINPALIQADLSVDDLNTILSNRAEDLNHSLNGYIVELIKRDLVLSGYIEGDK